MKKLLLILLLFDCLNSYSSVMIAYSVVKGKASSMVFSLDSDERFRSECLVNIVDSYLKKKLSNDDYKNFPRVDLEVSTDFEDDTLSELVISVTDTIIHCQVTAPNQLATKTLNLIDYVISNFKLLKGNEIYFYEDDDLETTLEKDTAQLRQYFERLLTNPPNPQMDSCLNVTFYRTIDNYKPILSCDSSKIIYSYTHDRFNLYGNGELITQIPNINFIIETKELGTFFFGTNSSFYFLRKYCQEIIANKYPRLLVNYQLSKRHMADSNYFRYLKIEWEDFEHQQICLYFTERERMFELDSKKDQENSKFYHYDKRTHQRTIINYTQSRYYDHRRKFLYLVDEDRIIPDFEIMEQKLIDSIKVSHQQSNN